MTPIEQRGLSHLAHELEAKASDLCAQWGADGPRRVENDAHAQQRARDMGKADAFNEAARLIRSLLEPSAG